ncbi:pyridoxal phosphate-dependent aminotransferase [Paenibacillus eucommiae]|uniref:Aminotransferase n=1 Tax=Paenibacillus eucommiae TaxID=1355755 RepID=A0ABS4J6Z6_9BACL|nr:pyridoxal phosphate-dependent aminotransferase [Paenibacillus eucommiae]MBP1995631.1 aspartate aminotransferase/aminotransferase [Paenibacillus eucommiae]
MKQLSSARSLIPESGIRKLAELSALIPDAIHLEVGEPNVNTPEHIMEAAAVAAREGFTKYTPVPGYPTLRKAIKEDLHARYNLNVSMDEIVVTSGSVMALSASLLAIADVGDEILVPDPAWPVYEMILRVQQCVPVPYVLKAEEGFIPDFEELEAKVTGRTKAIMINTPGNPTGGVFDEETIKRLMEFAVKHDLYVISDEVYDSIIYEGTHITPKAYDTDGRVISIFGVSKKYAMTGWRLGYSIANKEISALMIKIMITLVGNAPSTSQKAAEAALTGPQEFVEEMRLSYQSRRDRAYAMLVQEKIKCYPNKGAFYMLIDISETGMTSDDFALTLLSEEKVAVAPGSTFGVSSQNMVRISLATEETALLEGVRRICAFIAKNRKSSL